MYDRPVPCVSAVTSWRGVETHAAPAPIPKAIPAIATNCQSFTRSDFLAQSNQLGSSFFLFDFEEGDSRVLRRGSASEEETSMTDEVRKRDEARDAEVVWGAFVGDEGTVEGSGRR